MEIKLIENDKKQFLNLLLLADEQESMIDRYLERGDLYALYDEGLKSICVVTDEGAGRFELQSLATDPRFQGRGYGRRLVAHVVDLYRGRGHVMSVGTGDVPWILSFYGRCGFVPSHRIENFFPEHYDHPIFEEGILLRDKIYLKQSLDPSQASAPSAPQTKAAGGLLHE